MSASREKQNRKYQSAPEAEVKSHKNLIIGIIVAAVVILLIGSIVLFKGPLFRRNSTAVTVGTHELSPVTVRYFYADYFNTFSNNYGSLMTYLFTDTSNIDQQVYDEETGETWGDYFMDATMSQIKTTYAIYDEAVANGFELSEEDQEQLSSISSMIELYADYYGVSADEYVENVYGQGSNLKTFLAYQEIVLTAEGYQQAYVDALTYSDEEIEAAYNEDPSAYNYYTYHSYLITSDYDSDADDAAITAAKEAAKEAADAIDAEGADLDSWLAAVAAYAGNESYAEGTITLRSDYSTSSMAEEVAAWVSDSSRTEGDTAVIESSDNYYVLYYISCNTNDYATANARVIRFDAETDDDGNASFDTANERLSEFLAEFDDAELTDDFWSDAAYEYSDDDDTYSTGGIYETVYRGYFDDDTVNDWLLDSARTAGDTATVETADSIYFLYYEGAGQNYRDYLVTSELQYNDYSDWYANVTDIAEPKQQSFGMSYVVMTLNYSAS